MDRKKDDPGKRENKKSTKKKSRGIERVKD